MFIDAIRRRPAGSIIATSPKKSPWLSRPSKLMSFRLAVADSEMSEGAALRGAAQQPRCERESRLEGRAD
jgi:hypothetical protein